MTQRGQQDRPATNEKTMRLSLKAGEKIYINGAVLKAGGKLTFELLNDATFLLEAHVLQAEQTTTPLRQLYYAAQLMLIEPALATRARQTFTSMLRAMLSTIADEEISAALKQVDALVCDGRTYEALKIIRRLYPREERLLAGEIEASDSNLRMMKR